jgi:hypothetical protein
MRNDEVGFREVSRYWATGGTGGVGAGTGGGTGGTGGTGGVGAGTGGGGPYNAGMFTIFDRN